MNMGRVNDQKTSYFALCSGMSNIPNKSGRGNKGLL
jgi:hypothetical protein